MPSEHLSNASWRPVAPVAVRLLLVGSAVNECGIYQAEAQTLVGEPGAQVGIVFLVAQMRGVFYWHATLTTCMPARVKEQEPI